MGTINLGAFMLLALIGIISLICACFYVYYNHILVIEDECFEEKPDNVIHVQFGRLAETETEEYDQAA